MKRPVSRTPDGRLRLRLPLEGAHLLEGLLTELHDRIDTPDAPDQTRVFPRAYADEQAEARFRELTRGFLVASKHAAIDTVLEVLGRAQAGRDVLDVILDEDEAQALLGSINDLRLVLGTILEVTDEHHPAGFLPPDDPRSAEVNAYLWLGAVQEAVLEVLLGEM